MTKTGLETARPAQIERSTRRLDNADGPGDAAKARSGNKDDAFAALLKPKPGADRAHRTEDVHRGGEPRAAVTGPVAWASKSDGGAGMPEPAPGPEAAWSGALARSEARSGGKDDAFAALLKPGADRAHRAENGHRGGEVQVVDTGPVPRASKSAGGERMAVPVFEPDVDRGEALADSAGFAVLDVAAKAGAGLHARTGPPDGEPRATRASQHNRQVDGSAAAPDDRVGDAQTRATIKTAAVFDWPSNGVGKAPADSVARQAGVASFAVPDHATSRSPGGLVSGLVEPEFAPTGEAVRWSALKGEVVRQETHFPVVHPHHPDMRPVTGQVVRALKTMPAMSPSQSARSGLEPSTIATAQPLRILELRLQPAELGSVRLQLHLKGEVLTLKVSALRAETAELLQRDQSQLKDALRQAGIQVETLVFVKDAERVGGGALTAQPGEAGRQSGDATPDTSMSRGDQAAGRDERGARGRAAADEDLSVRTAATDPGSVERTEILRDDGLYL